MKFKAKAIHTIDQLEMIGMLNHPAHLGYGWFEGYHVDGYIVGRFVHVTTEYTHLDFWVPIDKRTLMIASVDE